MILAQKILDKSEKLDKNKPEENSSQVRNQSPERKNKNGSLF